MNPLLRPLALAALLLGTFAALRAAAQPSAVAPAAGANIVAAVRAADDERSAAMIAGDRARLEAAFSDDLRYAHSSGSVDTKASFIAALTSGRSDYQSIEPIERNIAPIAPGVALVTGRSRVKVLSGGNPLDLHLGYLAVFREENGTWRFLAWQSCRLPTSAAQ